MSEAPSRAALAEAFGTQARACGKMGSPLYEVLAGRIARDIAEGGAFADLVAGYRGHPLLDALPLRLLGAVHALVLSGRAPQLAAFYPSAGGRFEEAPAWNALCGLVAQHAPALREAATQGSVQTNEVRRSVVLLGGFLRLAWQTRLPLRLREIGASAGLNLFWDRHRYELGSWRWGDAAAELVLSAAWSGPAPDLIGRVEIADRRGCDLAPVDLRDAAQRVRLESFVWPDQETRLAQLRSAVAVAMREAPRVETERAGTWVAREVAPADGAVTVLFHSVMWWYLPEAERAQIAAAMEAAGAIASDRAPLAWLRMESSSPEEAELRLRCWPGGADELLAKAHPHGAWVRWLAPGGGAVV